MSPRKTLEKAAMEAQQVSYVRREVFNSTEAIALRGNVLILTGRGDLPVMRLLDQVYDQPNVVSIDLHINERSLINVRQLNKSIERRVQAMAKPGPDQRVSSVHIRIVAVIG